MKLLQEQDNKCQNGQAIIILIFFMAVIVIVVSASVTLMIASSTGQTSNSRGNQAKLIAESGAENAMLRLLRNPDYSGETLQVSQGQTIITVTGTAEDKTITSQAVYNSSTVTIQVQTRFDNGVLNIVSWKEI